MKLLYDTLKKKELGELFSRGTARLWPYLAKAEVFHIQNVADFYYAGTDQDVWTVTRDFPNLAPPFPAAFYEYQMPPVIRAGGHVIKSAPKAVGVLIAAVDLASGDQPFFVRGNVPGEPRWQLWCAPFFQEPASDAGLHVVTFVINVDATGRGLAHQHPEGDMLDSLVDVENQHLPDLDDYRKAGWGIICPALLATTFLHCKNVVVEREDPAGERRAAGKRSRHVPHTAYRTLDIIPMRKILERTGAAQHTGIQQAMHICRGHFKTFSDEHPLFGKHTGTYWWGDQVRGAREQGEVKKTYQVKTPPEDT